MPVWSRVTPNSARIASWPLVYYVEAHHVLPVSGLVAGSLGPANVICVCASHHRQLHYGDVSVSETAEGFQITLDGSTVQVRRN